ncbi:MAG: hypothetical protein H6871_04425 [Methylobacteriaceae bacterium]|nr:hypothetical protein [Methylobacteriaceae bacterium]
MRLLALIGVLAIAGALAAGGFFLNGFFDISTSWDDPPPVAKAIGARATHRSRAMR